MLKYDTAAEKSKAAISKQHVLALVIKSNIEPQVMEHPVNSAKVHSIVLCLNIYILIFVGVSHATLWKTMTTRPSSRSRLQRSCTWGLFIFSCFLIS